MAKKKTARKATPEYEFELDLPVEEPLCKFSLGEESIQSTVSHLHRMSVNAQQKAFDKRGDAVDFYQEYADELNLEFKTKVTITKEMAYRIADAVHQTFHIQKKRSTI